MIFNVNVRYRYLVTREVELFTIEIDTQKKKLTFFDYSTDGLANRIKKLIKKEWGKPITVRSGGEKNNIYYTKMLELDNPYTIDYINGFFNSYLLNLDFNIICSITGKEK